MSEVEARSQGFEDRVAHGLLLGALVSSIVGNELPGAGGVLQGVDLAFRRPCLAGDEILIELEVVDVFESVRTLEMKVSIRGPRGVLATGRVRSGLREKRD
jgi:acyl dehydratase